MPYCDVVCHSEGRNKINFPYSAVFELTGPKDSPLKEGYEWRLVPLGEPVERSNESRSEWEAKGFLHSTTCDRVDAEGNVGHWVVWPDDEEERAKWLAKAFLRQRK